GKGLVMLRSARASATTADTPSSGKVVLWVMRCSSLRLQRAANDPARSRFQCAEPSEEELRKRILTGRKSIAGAPRVPGRRCPQRLAASPSLDRLTATEAMTSSVHGTILERLS